MERVCWTMRVRPEKLDEYKARHREVWPEMLRRAARDRLGATTRCSSPTTAC